MKNRFPDSVCIQPTRSTCHAPGRGAAIIVSCLELPVQNSEFSLCEACCSLLSICQALSPSFFLVLPPRGAVATLPICSSSYLLLFSCTGLMTVWYLSRLPSVPWYALLCHCCCPVFLSSLFLLLLHPGSQPTLTYVSASHVLISNLTMLLTLISSSPELFVTLPDTPKLPLPLPQNFVSLHPSCPRPPMQDFLGQVHCTLGEIVGSPASRLEKSLGWVWALTSPKITNRQFCAVWRHGNELTFVPVLICPSAASQHNLIYDLFMFSLKMSCSLTCLLTDYGEI